MRSSKVTIQSFAVSRHLLAIWNANGAGGAVSPFNGSKIP